MPVFFLNRRDKEVGAIWICSETDGSESGSEKCSAIYEKTGSSRSSELSDKGWLSESIKE